MKNSLNLIQSNSTIKEAIKNLSITKIKTLVILNKQKFVGTLTDGDVRRALLKNINLHTKVDKISNKNPVVTKKTQYDLSIENILIKKKIDILPIVGKNKKFIDYHTVGKNKFTNPVDFVIMAGGFGKRLLPLTKKIPKPLIKIKNKHMIEYILSKAKKEKLNNISIVTYYKSSQIKNLIKKKYEYVKVFKENKPLGTIGGINILKLKKSNYNNTIITNCDVLTSISYTSFLKFHEYSKADMTVVTEMRKVQSPFGNIRLMNKKVTKFEEKPEYINNIVVGIYIVKNSVFKYLKNNKKIDIPDFKNLLIKKKKRIIPYPIIEKWIDIGTRKNLDDAKRYFS